MNNYKACDAASEENLSAESKATFYLLKMRDYFQGKKGSTGVKELVYKTSTCRHLDLTFANMSLYNDSLTFYNELSLAGYYYLNVK